MPFVPDQRPRSRFVPDAPSTPEEDSSFTGTLGKIGDAGKKLVTGDFSLATVAERNKMSTGARVKDDLKGFAKGGRELVTGVPEVLLSGATGALSSAKNVVNAATGAKELFKNSGESDADFYRRSRAETTYEPRSEGGKRINQLLSDTVGKVMNVAPGVKALTGSDTAGELANDVVNIGLAAATGRGAKPAAAVEKPAAAVEKPALARDATIPDSPVAALRQAGYRIRPSDAAKAEPESPKPAASTVERYAGSDELRKSMMTSNQKTTTRLSAEELGLPTNTPRLTRKIYDQARQEPLAKYREVGRAVGKFELSPEFSTDLDAISKRTGLEPKTRRDVAKIVEQYRLPSATGPDAIKTVSVLRRRAAQQIQSDKPELQDTGIANRAVADALEAELDRQLTGSGQGELAVQFKDARAALAKIHDTESATKAGQVDAHVLNSMQKKGIPLSGRLAIIADAAEYAPHVTKHPNSVNNVSGGGALPGAGPLMDMASGFTRPIARKVMESDLYQNRLGKSESIGPNAGLSDYFRKPPPDDGAPLKGGTPIPKTPSSSMLEAQKRAGDLSLADEVLNQEQLPESPSRLQAETPPQSRGDLPFKASEPSGVDLAGDLGLAPEVAPSGIPGGQNPRAAGMSENVKGTSLFPELRAIRSGRDVVEPPELSLMPEADEPNAPPPQNGGSPIPPGGPTLADELGIKVVPSTNKPGFFEIHTPGEKSANLVQGEENARGLADELAVEIIPNRKTSIELAREYRSRSGQIQNNASGESSASVEAINRVKSEKAAGRDRYLIDQDGNMTPLNGVDSVDATAPNGQVIVQRGIGDTEYSILDRGGLSKQHANGLLNRALATAKPKKRAVGE